ncbi:MAG TPA: type II toxin-antitoxin system prevent-host-death family antitoxin [Actinomycetota bacterium]
MAESVMEERVVMASRFKERCLALLDQVAETKVPVVVTKHGKPVAKLVPIDEPVAKPMMGSVRLLVEDDESYFSTGESWVAEGPHGE